MPRIHAPLDELSQSSLEGQVVVRVSRRLAQRGSSSTPWARRICSWSRAAHGAAPLACRFYAVVKDPRRGKRQGRDEPRAQESSKRVYGSSAGVPPQAVYSGEARAPKSIIPEGKKGIRGLTIVFMEIRVVTDFSEEILTGRNRRVSRYHCRNKVTGDIGLRRLRRKNV
jgi:hypothetical protein